MNRRLLFYLFFAVVIAFCLADVGTTVILSGRGYEEANPVMANLIDRGIVYFVLINVFLSVTIAIVIADVSIRTFPELSFYAFLPLIVFVSLRVLGTINNLILLYPGWVLCSGPAGYFPSCSLMVLT